MSVTLVHPRPKFAPALLTEPPPSGYLHIAASVEPPGGIGRPGHSRDKTHLLDLLRAEAEDLASLGEVKRASVYRAAAVAPTVGLHPSDTVHPARYDVVPVGVTHEGLRAGATVALRMGVAALFAFWLVEAVWMKAPLSTNRFVTMPLKGARIRV